MYHFRLHIGYILSLFLLLLIGGTLPTAQATTAFPTPTPLPGMTTAAESGGASGVAPALPPLPPTTCGGQWTAVPSADLGTGSHDGTLNGIAAVTADNVWAVGQYLDRDNSQRPIIEHWNGASWTLFSSPVTFGALFGITAVAPNDIWAVGASLIEHWDGTSWQATPHPPASNFTLYSLTAVTANDVWAVGVYHGNGTDAQTLAMHWNGSQWSVLPSPNPPGRYNEFYGVRALTPNNVWAVGYYNTDGPISSSYPLIAHWDGTSWNEVSNPATSGYITYLADLAVIAANDIWAVGNVNTNTSSTPLEHWDGNTWSPYTGTLGGTLDSATVLAPDNIWAAGRYGTSTLTEHWDGAHWNVITSQSPSANANNLHGIAAVDPDNVWAVGWLNSWSGQNRTPLLERYSNNPYYVSNGDDTYQLTIAANCTGNISANLNLKRYYGPLADGSATGHIGPAALGNTVENNARLKISFTARGANETIVLNFAGQSYTRQLTPSGGVENTIEIQIPTTSLILPRRGTDTSPPPDALNPITITGDSQGAITRIRLELRGMRPLVLMSGFNPDVTSPDDAETSGYFHWVWNNAAVSDMLQMPDRNGHASIVGGGRDLAVKVDGVKRRYGVSKVNILGHSMGGLWGRDFVANNPSSADKMMMLGTPNRGSIFAEAAVALVKALCLRGPVECIAARAAYAQRSPAIHDLTGSAVGAYNGSHGWVPGVTYADVAGETLVRGVPVPDDGAVSVSSEQELAYSTHLPSIVKSGFVHTQEYSDLDFRNAFVAYYTMGANHYGPAAALTNKQTPPTTLPAADLPPPVQYPAVVGAVLTGEVETGTITVDNATSASFGLSWFNYSSTLSLTLHDPAGQVITPTTPYSGSTYLTTLFGGMYTIQSPLPGTWQVNVRGDAVAGASEQFAVTGELVGGVQITPFVTGFAAPGQPVMVRAILSDTTLLNGAIITATVSIPNSNSWNIATFPLTEQGNGVYQGTFTPTISGTHSITIFAQGVNSQTQPFSRTQITQVIVGSGASLTGNFSDWAYDTDGDALYNSLVISATANISETGVYRLGGYLTKADGTIVAYSTATYTASLGVRDLPLNFAGQDIAGSLADGPYQLRNLYFSRVMSDELGLVLLPTAYTTSTYSRYSWQRDNVLLSGPITDVGVDTNGNGQYDYLEVRVPVDIRTPGNYSASLNLVAPDGNVITSSSVSNISLVQGSNILTLRFLGTAIRSYGANGPYQVEDLSLGAIGIPTSYISTVLPQTQAYLSTQFEGLPQPSPTPSPTPTVTACSLSFSDVADSTAYFYSAVYYLACRGVISGYSDGTFRPYNQTTRAQLSKIVVGGEGWASDTTGGPHFTDVAVGSTFYNFIETAYHHGIISGYSDGTFRPSANVTRGQLSKIIVGAQEWPAVTTGGPHFNDVAADSIFYGAIETAYAHGIIGGYSDGTFRPSNPATRGQIAKIVYLALQSP